MKTKDRKKYGYIILLIMLICVILAILITNNISKKVAIQKDTINQKIETRFVNTENDGQNQEKNIIEKEETNLENTILTTYKGYPVIAKLEIPKIELETYVLSEYSEQALGVSVTKFYGGNPNEVGNFCIAGHNYITKNMFHDIKKLSIGDTFILTDANNRKVTYQIYLVETVEPNETQCLSQKTEGRTEVTLITCTTDSSKRIIIKAVKI